MAGDGRGAKLGIPGVKGARWLPIPPVDTGVGGGGGKCLDIKTGRCSFDTVLNFSTKTSIILTSNSLPFPPSDSDLSLIHSTKLSKSLQLIVWIEVGSDSSWTFLLDS